jgi:hypothetical protein
MERRGGGEPSSVVMVGKEALLGKEEDGRRGPVRELQRRGGGSVRPTGRAADGGGRCQRRTIAQSGGRGGTRSGWGPVGVVMGQPREEEIGSGLRRIVSFRNYSKKFKLT